MLPRLPQSQQVMRPDTTLTTGNDTVVGTADDFVDVVTATVGTGATLTAGDAISDAGTGDGDIVNISGDGAVNLGAYYWHFRF